MLMESRTFRILPVQSSSPEKDMSDVREPYLRSDKPSRCEFDNNKKDTILITRPKRKSNQKVCKEILTKPHKSNLGRSNPKSSRGYATVDDARNDEPSLSMVLRAFNANKQHPSPTGKPEHQKTSSNRGTSSEFEKRIAQLQNAGLSISSKGKDNSLSQTKPRSNVTKASPSQDQEEEREPLSVSGNPNHFRGLVSNTNTLMALLEKDAKHPRVIQVPVASSHSPDIQDKTFKVGPPSRLSFSPLFKEDEIEDICVESKDLLEIDSDHSRSQIPSPPQPEPLVSCFDPTIRTSNRSTLSRSQPTLEIRAPDNETVDPIIAARPAYHGLRVSAREYPDPVTFGWAFLGSCLERKFEFFEKDLGKDRGSMVLEFQYTTGTAKVTLEHPLWGESLLAFALGGSQVSPSGFSPEIYRKILTDPLGCSSSSKRPSSNPRATTTTGNTDAFASRDTMGSASYSNRQQQLWGSTRVSSKDLRCPPPR